VNPWPPKWGAAEAVGAAMGDSPSPTVTNPLRHRLLRTRRRASGTTRQVIKQVSSLRSASSRRAHGVDGQSLLSGEADKTRWGEYFC
jgi:hypothetical protein